MAATYIPTQQALYAQFMQTMYDALTTSPTAYGLTAEQVVDFATKQEAFAAAYALAINPSTRTSPVLKTKETARQECTVALRPLVQVMQAWPGMTNQKREALGLTIPDVNPSPIPKPSTSPVLSVAKVSGRSITINLRERLSDGNPSERRGKPAGVKGAGLFYATGDTPPVSAEGWTFRGNASTTTTIIEIPGSVPAGANVWLTAQWFNPRLQTGPACPAVLTSVTNAGDLAMAA